MNKLVKNLLTDKTCGNCNYWSWTREICTFRDNEYNLKNTEIPTLYNTCNDWELYEYAKNFNLSYSEIDDLLENKN